MKLDTHVHSSYSFDCLMDPDWILRAARARGLSVIAITDHDSMAVYRDHFGVADDRRVLHVHGVTVVRGMEVSTRSGDVIGLFLHEAVETDDFEEAVAAFREQGGLVVLPHPYDRPVDPEGLLDDVDVIEVRNGRSRRNGEARRLASDHDLPVVGGSDAHMYWEVGQVATVVDGPAESRLDPEDVRELLEAPGKSVVGDPLPYYLTHGVSFLSGRLDRLAGGLAAGGGGR